MLRFRRYRVFLVVALVFTILVIRLKQSGEWPTYAQIESLRYPSSVKGTTTTPSTAKDAVKEGLHSPVVQNSKAQVVGKATSTAPTVPTTKPNSDVVETVPKVVLPGRKPISPTRVYDDDEEADGVHAVSPPGRQELPVLPPVPTVIHWERQVEHFPVPKESIIPLPVGSPNRIPRIQYDFDEETSDVKINRQKRQDTVRAEFQRAWAGYKGKAWLHDELSPVSGKFRDPFCGWAATLVDTLDTLWIMGLREDFEEAAKAVDLIDFTTSPRADIPVFETTIRYLGGLLAAYDVSGAAYKNLLDKAVELAEILMGIFDTPNRMPDLYYRWKPAFASQSHRAGMRSNLAELGSLSMEFTRLAQITKDNRYYDAIARITNALSEWQDRGTMLDGVFPDNVDASGCNRTHIVQQPHRSGRESEVFPAKVAEAPVGFQPEVPDPVPEQRPNKQNLGSSGPGTLKMEVSPGVPGKARISEWEHKRRSSGSSKMMAKRDPVDMPAANKTVPKAATDPETGLPLDMNAAKAKIGSEVGDWDCVPQGLEPASPHGINKFSMGGGQDSTYEYFPKVCNAFLTLTAN
jgi:mannosyl-oligosaccharide alpha-1,2-mannosidase